MMSAAMDRLQPFNRHGGAFETSPFRGFGEVSMVQCPTLLPRLIAPLPGDWHGTCHNTYMTRARGNGVAAFSAGGTGRGGARNRADRESHALTAAQIGNLTAATAHADAIDLPFTRAICIHWESAGIPLEAIAKATRRFLDLLTKWLARLNCRTAWLWVHEGGDGKGGHCHLLAHVPPEHVKVLTGHVKGWLRRITGKPYRKDVIYSRPIGKLLGAEVSNPADHAINLESALAYVLKGASPKAASHFGLERLEPGGRVIGKRCGTSQNIGSTSRSKSVAAYMVE
jgi:hypothetical protein